MQFTMSPKSFQSIFGLQYTISHQKKMTKILLTNFFQKKKKKTLVFFHFLKFLLRMFLSFCTTLQLNDNLRKDIAGLKVQKHCKLHCS